MTYTYGSITNATIVGSSAKPYEVRTGYELLGQSQEANQSTLSVILQCRTTNDTYQTWGFKQTSKIKVLDGDTTLQDITLSAKTFSIKTENAWVTFATKTIVVDHNEDGKFDDKITASFTTNCSETYALKSGSASVTPNIPVIPRYTLVESLNGDYLGNEVSIELSRMLDTYKHTIEYSFEGSEYVVAGSGIDTSFAFTPSLELASQIPNATSGLLTVKVSTYLEDTKLGELTSTITLSIPDDVLPSINGIATIPVSSNVPSDWGVYVKSNSQASFTVEASGVYGSTIKSYSIVGASQSYSGESNAFTTEMLNTAGTFEFVITVTDSRDRTNNQTVSINVIDYFKPSITAVIKRCNEDGTINPSGTYLNVVATYLYASIDGNNGITKSVVANGVTSYDFESGVEYVLNANMVASQNYTVVFEIVDALGYSATVSYLSPKDTRVMNVTKDKDGIAFNGFAEKEKMKCGYPTDFLQDYACPVGQVLMTSSPTPPSIGEWELIDKEFAPQRINADNFTINTTNTTSATLTVDIAGHDMDFRLQTVNKTAINEDEKKRGTIILSAIGVTELPMSKQQLVGTSDGGNAWSLWSVVYDTGVINTVDCDASSTTVPAGNTNYVHWHTTVKEIGTMIDDFCNKFYWKRIA